MEHKQQRSLTDVLRFYKMPEDNIDMAINQIAQGYGACRYLDGVNAGAEAVDKIKYEEAVTNEPVSLERANKQKVLSDITSLIEDIDKWTGEYVSGSVLQNSNRVIAARRQLESLLVAAHQELAFLYDYIKEGGKDD